ncbi:hypothetical protein FHR33_007477 [Nonomuraea dietziae]|uniref:Uncharacterized protein n=1 Tax=Nonomuraea dietziae TaxID=65515 RepID=A0A7W5YRZ6_9ACTN|nr:hypothetical protein [Nonomuraea dietziae]MBB3731617.1 hypothetical protein [Nonomuraea dietziae]
MSRRTATFQPGPGRQARGGDPYGQRQERARLGHRDGGLGLGGDPGPARDGAQQAERLGPGQHVEVVRAGSGEGGQPGAPRDDHRALRSAREQRPDLCLRRRVVEQDQHPAAVEQRAVEGGPVGEAGGRAADAERAEEPFQRVGRIHRVAASAQVDGQLAVGEAAPDPVGHPYGERGLADAADARDDVDGQGGAGGQLGGQRLDQFGPAGEVGEIGGQLGGPHGRPRRGKLTPQDAQVQLRQLWRGVDAQLVAQERAQVGVDGQRLGLPSRPVQGEHEQGAQPFAQRVGSHQRAQLGHRLGVQARLEVGLDGAFQHRQAALLQPGALRGGVAALEPRQRLAAPQRQRLARPARRQRLELLRVGGDPAQRVSVTDQGDRSRREHGPQPGGVGAQHVERGAGRVVLPQRVEEGVPAQRPAAGQREGRQQQALPGPAEVGVPRADLAEQLEPHTWLGTAPP